MTDKYNLRFILIFYFQDNFAPLTHPQSQANNEITFKSFLITDQHKNLIITKSMKNLFSFFYLICST